MTRRLLLSCALALVACDGAAGTIPDCNDLELGGSCFVRPTAPIARTACGVFRDFCGDGSTTSPQLACLDGTAATPVDKRVTVTGFVGVFATGPDTDNLTIQAFEQSTLATGSNPATLTPFARASTARTLTDATTMRACDADSTVGCVTPATTCSIDCADGLEGRADKGFYCHALASGGDACGKRARWEARYTLASNVPVGRPIAIRVTGPDGTSDHRWTSTITFGVIVPSTAPACATDTSVECYDASGAYRLDLTALSLVDYLGLPQRAGLMGGITAGQGAIIGQVHDCDGVRLANAQVGFIAADQPDRVTYFDTSDPAVPFPDAGRAQLGTDPSGLYAAFNFQPGAVTVEAAGLLTADGALVGLGAVESRVYANTVTLVGLSGARPRPRLVVDGGAPTF